MDKVDRWKSVLRVRHYRFIEWRDDTGDIVVGEPVLLHPHPTPIEIPLEKQLMKKCVRYTLCSEAENFSVCEF